MGQGETALEAGAAEPTPGALGRIVLVVGWLCAVALAVLVLHLLGVDVGGWFASLWDALTAVDPEDVLMGLGLQTLDTLLSAIAWLAILRAAYPRAGIEALPIITAYAVAVAGNDILPASLGTLVMLVMLTAIIPAATFPGLVGGQVVHKLFFVAAGNVRLGRAAQRRRRGSAGVRDGLVVRLTRMVLPPPTRSPRARASGFRVRRP